MISKRIFQSALAVASVWLSPVLATPAAAQSVSFVARQDFSTGGRFVNDVARADFNGDGIADLVTANSSSGASILLGNVDGTFQRGRTFVAGGGPRAVATGDFNGDGTQDVVVANAFSASISVLLGVGDGTLQDAQHYAVGSTPSSIAVADFNEDGALDLVVANNGTGDNSYSMLFGNGDGTFQPADNQNIGATPRAVIATDVNADGNVDVVVVNEGVCCFSAYDVAVRLGHGNGLFRGADRYPVSERPRSVAAGDLNGDGITDLAVASDGGWLTILLGVGDGTFAPAPHPAPRLSGNFIAIADLNADGILDVAVAGGMYQVAVALGNGDASFQPPLTLQAGRSPKSIAVDDFNRDGTLDLAVGGSSFVALLLGIGDGTFRAERTSALGPEGWGGPSSVAAGDLNADGILDLVVPTWGGTSVLLGAGAGTFQLTATLSPSSAYQSSTVISDFNGDGTPDIVVANAGFPQVLDRGRTSLHLGNGDGTFQPASTIATGGAAHSAAAGDFNHDGFMDVALANNFSNTLSVLLGNGDGTFQPVRTLAAGPAPRSVAVGDLGGDGHPDLVAAINGSGNVAVFAGNGDGTFEAAQTYAAGPSPVAVVIVDLNADGIPDVAAADAGPLGGGGPGRVSALLGNGDGTLQAAQTFGVGDSPWALVAADFDGDGTPDLATSNVESNNVSVLLNDGSGSFPSSIEFGAGNDAWALAAGDFDADGRQDIAVVNQRSDPTGDLSILINDTAPQAPPTFHELAVSKDGNGGGVVTSTSTPESWNQIDCGNTCTATYVGGSIVRLTAQADTGSTFAGWSGCDEVSDNTCTVTMNEARFVTATFVLQRFTLTVSKGGVGRGTVSSTSNPPSPTQINCGTRCSVSYDWNTTVTLSASPAFGNIFLGWSGCDASAGQTCRVTMNSGRSVTANFVGLPLALTPRF